MGKLQDKVAIVTGAGQGIGRGISLAFAKEGARVVIAEMNPKTGKSVGKEIRNLGGQALVVVCDVSVEEQVNNMVDQAVKKFGPIDILVNNAQYVDWIDIEFLSELAWDNTFNTGVKATWLCCKAVFPYMKERGGKIINFGSGAGAEGRGAFAHYNANKEAIRGFSRTAAREWGKYKINVNVLCPAAMTPIQQMYEKLQPEEFKKSLEQITLGRVGDPERDIGRTAVFLASEDSDFITGQTINCDGGYIYT